MSTTRTDRCCRSRRAAATALALVAAALNWYPVNVSAQEQAGAHQSPGMHGVSARVADLEAAFWSCDHAATTRIVPLDLAATCVAITEELKNQRFGGDFETMLRWWQQNKVAQHRLLGAGNR